ncbi:MAG: hypothetical protein ABI847_12545 [Anaerolineales bacterium]
MIIELTELYLCERCFSVAEAPGPCPRCHLPRRHCQPGAADSPGRRPPIDADGRLLSRAPQWWVQLGALPRPPADEAAAQ